ncbi:MAG: magnesium-translocating P-type ATPase [Chloroherpetonaceae bacterium]|nr:magnesium-translocating P-type ATPase [Chthonomonadaceae bacterium]MDW8207899.1 magnesium-translocating P-type ATPase [Chloroherpetonaceae bacterium]
MTTLFLHKNILKRGERTSSGRASRLLLQAARLNGESVYELTGAHRDGLLEAEAHARLQKYGPNQVAHEKPPAWYVLLWRSFANPFNGVLAALAIASLFLDVLLVAPEERSWRTILVLTTMITVSGMLRFFQEFRSNRAAEALKAMVRTRATVSRRQQGVITRREVPIEELVPGDIVHLSAGDMIPADVRLLTSKDLFVSQSILTGESIPVEKFDTLANVVEKSANDTADSAGNVLELRNVGFMGTSVVSGTATAVVVATGADTYFGSMAKHLIGHRAQTSFDRGVNAVSWLLIKFMFVMVPIVFAINAATKHNVLDALLFSLSVAVGLTPEMLPMIVTANLARGAIAMSRKKCIVKRLNAIQNFGAMNILCTDKTGTLTRDKVVLERYIDLYGRPNPEVLYYTFLNSYHQTGLKNLLDVAVLEHVELHEKLDITRHYEKVDEIPFDFNRRRMTVVLEKDHETRLLICKGAVEEVLSVCTHVDLGAQCADTPVVPMTAQWREKALQLAAEMNAEGLRTVAVAYREAPADDTIYRVADERELVLAGFVGFLDPPKEDAAAAIQALQAHGVTVKVLTGDSDVIARNVCKQVGLPVDAIVLGRDIEHLDDAALGELAERTTIFAKLTPTQKARIIRALQQRGHTVGYLGDGINDAAALRDADVGISVDTGTDIAKESADIIMLEKDLMVLEEGILEGRNTFGNIIKYIKMTASSNFGNVFSVLVASAFIPFLPMLPIHLLVQNLLYDFSQTMIPFDRVDPEYLQKPRKWYAGDIGRFMVLIGPISSIFDITTYALMWYVFQANSVERQTLFQSGWFVEGLLSQTLIVHMIRTQKIPFLQSRATWPVMTATFMIMAIGIVLPFTPAGAALRMQPLPASYFPWLAATLLAYCVLAQIAKTLYIRKFQMWL